MAISVKTRCLPYGGIVHACALERSYPAAQGVALVGIVARFDRGWICRMECDEDCGGSCRGVVVSIAVGACVAGEYVGGFALGVLCAVK